WSGWPIYWDIAGPRSGHPDQNGWTGSIVSGRRTWREPTS
ncbi:MAG: hypothetical protein AVDCRST_MAG33-3265, partial [uncultured Thermomicrobiales bacterium]